MSHKFLFTGEGSYDLHQTIVQWRKAFIEKYTEQGFFEFKGESVELGAIKNAVMGGGMFTQKKLIIIHGIPKENDATYKIPASAQTSVETRLTKVWDSIPQEHVIVLVCHKPDKRTKGRKFFEKTAEVKEFKLLKAKGAAKFLSGVLGDLITMEQADFLVGLIGTNKWNLTHEAEKLKLYASFHQSNSLNNDQLSQIVYHQGESNAFALLDLLFTNKEESINLLTKLQTQNQDIFQFTGMLYRGLKIVIQMTDCFQRGINNGKEIASTIKAPPFSVMKQMKYRDNYIQNAQRIKTFYKELVLIDHSIKTGRLPVEGFRVTIKKLVHTL